MSEIFQQRFNIFEKLRYIGELILKLRAVQLAILVLLIQLVTA